MGEDRIVLYNGQTREEAFSFPIPKAKEMNIRKLRILLAENLDVQYGKKFDRYELTPNNGVKVYFDDGTTEQGDMVIGIDGAGSKVRQCLIDRGATQETLPFALMNFNASYTAEQALFIKERLHPLVDIAIHPAGHYIRANVLATAGKLPGLKADALTTGLDHPRLIEVLTNGDMLVAEFKKQARPAKDPFRAHRGIGCASATQSVSRFSHNVVVRYGGDRDAKSARWSLKSRAISSAWLYFAAPIAWATEMALPPLLMKNVAHVLPAPVDSCSAPVASVRAPSQRAAMVASSSCTIAARPNGFMACAVP